MTIPPDFPVGPLVSLLHRTHSSVLRARLKPLGLSAGQFPILLFLSRQEGISQETLARHFSLDKATIARAVRRLEEDGFLCRRTDPGNRRAYGLFLEEKGKQVLPEILGADCRREKDVLVVLPVAARDEFLRHLRTVTEHSCHIEGSGCDCTFR